jgi:hypothetical protein
MHIDMGVSVVTECGGARDVSLQGDSRDIPVVQVADPYDTEFEEQSGLCGWEVPETTRLGVGWEPERAGWSEFDGSTAGRELIVSTTVDVIASMRRY